ncbi:uncharacterized protein [Ranitomeya imitator]|uniref:uncharacterized protein n=1 Tax=Ranitomeya imitator TaxID=111125 RepID=UPI0037E7046A
MSEVDGSSPPPSYEDLVPTIEQYEIHCIYNVALYRNYLSPSNQDHGINTPTSISVPPTVILDMTSPPDYCELPPPYSIEDPPSQLGSPPPVGLQPPVHPPLPVGPRPPFYLPPSVGPRPLVDPPPPVDYPPREETAPPYLGDSGQQVRSPPPNAGDSTQQGSEIPFQPGPYSCMTCSVINFILCPLYGIVPLVFSLMIHKGDIITARKYSHKVVLLNILAMSLSILLYIMLCCIMVPLLVGKRSTSSSGSSQSSMFVSGDYSCC